MLGLPAAEQQPFPPTSKSKTSKTRMQPRGKSIRAFHFIRQDETQQASFSWYSDAEDIKEVSKRSNDMTTVIVTLTNEVSAMRIWGCEPHFYEGQGSAVAFPGAALHESVPRAAAAPACQPLWKVALFWC